MIDDQMGLYVLDNGWKPLYNHSIFRTKAFLILFGDAFSVFNYN